jgi:DNA-binding transcriptional MocR family regulator
MAAYLDSECVVSVGSFSKILAPGLRLGWVQSCPKILERMAGAGIFPSGGGVNHFTGCLVREVLTSGDQALYLDSLLTIYRRRVELMDRLLSEQLGEQVRWRKPEGGYFFWLEMVDGRDAAALLEKATAAQVGYRHGARFSTRGDFASYLRLSFAHYGEDDIARPVERLARVLA